MPQPQDPGQTSNPEPSRSTGSTQGRSSVLGKESRYPNQRVQAVWYWHKQWPNRQEADGYWGQLNRHERKAFAAKARKVKLKKVEKVEAAQPVAEQVVPSPSASV